MNSQLQSDAGRRFLISPFLFCGLLLVPSVIWLWLDHHVWDWDPAEYGYFSIDLWRILWTETRLWPWWFFHAVGPKAPTLIWIAHFLLPLRHVLGSAQNVFNLINLSFQWASLFLLWQCIHRVSGKKWLAYVMCIWIAGMPMFVGMSQDFLTEPIQFFAVVFIWYIAVMGQKWTACRLAAFLLIGGGLVLGAKASTPAYCFVPGVYALWLLGKKIRERAWGANLWNGLGMAAGIFHLAILALWYATNWNGVMGKIVGASTGGEGCVANEFGYKDTFINKLFFWGTWLKRSVTLDAMAPLLVFMLVGLVVVSVWVIWCRKDKTHCVRWNARVCMLAGLQFVVVLVMLSANIATLTRYVYAAIPSLILCLVSLARAAGGGAAVRLMALGMGIWYTGSHVLLLGLVPSERVRNARHWASPERDQSKLGQVRYVIQLLNIREYSGVYHLCGVDYPWLSGSTLNFYAALDSLDSGYRTQFGRLGTPVQSTESAWERVHSQLGSYIAASDVWMGKRTDGYGEISREILRRIKQDPRFACEDHEALSDIVLYRNVAFGGKETGGQP